MANARGDVKVRLGNRHLTLRLTLGAAMELEDALGVDNLAALNMVIVQPSARQLATIYCVLAKAGGSEISEDDLLTFPPPVLHAHIGEVLDAAMPAPEDDAYAKKPKDDGRPKG